MSPRAAETKRKRANKTIDFISFVVGVVSETKEKRERRLKYYAPKVNNWIIFLSVKKYIFMDFFWEY